MNRLIIDCFIISCHAYHILLKPQGILDCGASDHITPDLSLLHNVKPVRTPCYITMPNGKIPSKDTRTDPIICSSTIINHILLGFKKEFSNISVPPYGMALLLFFN